MQEFGAETLEALRLIARLIADNERPAVADLLFYRRREPGPPREPGEWRLMVADRRGRWIYVASFPAPVVGDLVRLEVLAPRVIDDAPREHYALGERAREICSALPPANPRLRPRDPPPAERPQRGTWGSRRFVNGRR